MFHINTVTYCKISVVQTDDGAQINGEQMSSAAWSVGPDVPFVSGGSMSVAVIGSVIHVCGGLHDGTLSTGNHNS